MGKNAGGDPTPGLMPTSYALTPPSQHRLTGCRLLLRQPATLPAQGTFPA